MKKVRMSMNIESQKVSQTNKVEVVKTSQAQAENTSNFADELKELEKEKKVSETQECESENAEKSTGLQNLEQQTPVHNDSKQIYSTAIEGLNTVVKELNQPEELKFETKQKLEFLETVNQSEEKGLGRVQNYGDNADNVNMNVNDINTNENPELLAQMSPNMNFSNNQQSFSSLMEQNAKSQKTANILGNNSAELAEEANVLSTMAENIAMANRTLIKEDGIVKVDAKTGIKIENVVKFDSIIMNQADVEVFSSLVNNTELNLNELTSESVQKSVQISKTLADMLARAKETNQPLRIDFDNNISVIIKISRDGKISADFLPSSQVAEAYLKENLPLLRQKFDENGIKYDDLNQRERKNQEERNNNRKKGRNDE